MEMMDVKKLIPHKRNTYFFDDMDGEPWVAFLESIETSGIIEPIVVTQNLVIVSGHQRVRAALKLGIEKVAVEIRNYDSDDEVLKQLIETNIRQRGIGNTNAVKLMRCEKELERIYGIKQGNNQHTESIETKFPSKTQTQLAEEMGVTPQYWRNIKNIEKLAPEVQDMLESGRVSESAVRGLYRVLTPEQQRAFAEEFADKDKVSGREVEHYKKRVLAQQEEINELRKRQPEVVEKTVEVVPDDYEDLKKSNESMKIDYKRMAQERLDAIKRADDAEKRIKELENPSNAEKVIDEAKDQMDYFAIATYNFVRKYGGFVWAFDKWNDVPASTRKNFADAINVLNSFSLQMKEDLKGVN